MRMSYEDSIRILLNGTCGVTPQRVYNACGVSRRTVHLFMEATVETQQSSIDTMAWFVWRQMNSHLLIANSDKL